MLIITRYIGETIHVDDDITIAVLDVRGRQIKLGVNAPRDVPVHREEIHRRIQADTGMEPLVAAR